MHVDDAVHPPSTHFRSPGFAHAPLHPPPHSALSTVHAWLQCHFPTSYTPAHFHEHAYTAPIHPRHQTSHPPFARTHLALRPRLSTRFSTLPLTLLSVDRRILRSFSVAMATVPALIYIRARCVLAVSISLSPSLPRLADPRQHLCTVAVAVAVATLCATDVFFSIIIYTLVCI